MFSVFVAPYICPLEMKQISWFHAHQGIESSSVNVVVLASSWVPNALTCFLFADVKRSASTAQDGKLTRVASANEEWKSSEDRNLWLDTLDLDEDFVTSDEDQNDLESNVSHGNNLNNGLCLPFFFARLLSSL